MLKETNMNIQALTQSARKVHGADISILIARATAWGNTDNLLLVSGRNHRGAAADIARAAVRIGAKPRITEANTTNHIGGGVRVHSEVQFA